MFATCFSESRMLRQRCPGGRSRGGACRGHRVRVAEVPSDTLVPADVLEHAESRACLASDYLIRVAKESGIYLPPAQGEGKR